MKVSKIKVNVEAITIVVPTSIHISIIIHVWFLYRMGLAGADRELGALYTVLITAENTPTAIRTEPLKRCTTTTQF